MKLYNGVFILQQRGLEVLKKCQFISFLFLFFFLAFCFGDFMEIIEFSTHGPRVLYMHDLKERDY